MRSCGKDTHLLFCLIVMKTTVLSECSASMYGSVRRWNQFKLSLFSHNSSKESGAWAAHRPTKSPRWYTKYITSYAITPRRYSDDITAHRHGWLPCGRWHNVPTMSHCEGDIEVTARATIWLQRHRHTSKAPLTESVERVVFWNRVALSCQRAILAA